MPAGRAGSRPADHELLASRSNSAQSSALRAAPAGIAACRRLPVQSPGKRFLHRLKGCQRRFRRLAITRVGHAFAAPGMAAMADGRRPP